MENFKLLSISELKGKRFLVPNYQRGYKWDKEQVKDLLKDIEEFMCTDSNLVGQSYCIQPLVVGFADKEQDLLEKIQKAQSLTDIENLLSQRRMEVIDGQQRLTTIFIFLSALGLNTPEDCLYSLEYETRKDSESFLKKICSKKHIDEVERESCNNEDYYHIFEAYSLADEWLSTKDETFKKNFTHTLLNSVKFIWYLSSDPNPVQVFRRLNDGKITLTDAELIKALVLHCDDGITEHTYERASEWDSFEVQLQDDEFWLFFQNEIEYGKPSRIEWIFDLICESDLLGISNFDEDFREKLGTDNHTTFRYFDLYLRLHIIHERDKASQIWNNVKSIMAAINEWYTDNQLYHYVGYLIHQRTSLISIYKRWSEPGITKKEFLRFLKGEIIKKIAGSKDLSKVYENKRVCLPLLLLHNIEEVLWQNSNLQNERRFGMGAFYKFPFHLYKKEERKGGRNGWEIEHIASNSGDSGEIKEQALYLETSKLAIHDRTLYEKIEKFVFAENESDRFSIIKEEIRRYLNEEEWNENDKNKIWNFALLDSGTNQEYQNSVFPFKRLFILNKEAGIKTSMRYDEKENKAIIESKGRAVSFIPPVTKKVFTKSFKQAPTTLCSWTLYDAKNYLLDLELKTEQYLPKVYRWLRLNSKADNCASIISTVDLETLMNWRLFIVMLDKIINQAKI